MMHNFSSAAIRLASAVCHEWQEPLECGRHLRVPNNSIPKIAPTVEHRIALAYFFPILFGFGT